MVERCGQSNSSLLTRHVRGSLAIKLVWQHVYGTRSRLLRPCGCSAYCKRTSVRFQNSETLLTNYCRNIPADMTDSHVLNANCCSQSPAWDQRLQRLLLSP